MGHTHRPQSQAIYALYLTCSREGGRLERGSSNLHNSPASVWLKSRTGKWGYHKEGPQRRLVIQVSPRFFLAPKSNILLLLFRYHISLHNRRNRTFPPASHNCSTPVFLRKKIGIKYVTIMLWDTVFQQFSGNLRQQMLTYLLLTLTSQLTCDLGEVEDRLGTGLPLGFMVYWGLQPESPRSQPLTNHNATLAFLKPVPGLRQAADRNKDKLWQKAGAS